MTTSEPIEPTRAASTSVPVRQPAPPHGVLRALLSLPVHLYHARLGFLLGHRFLLLVHTGRRTGLSRETVLEVMRYDPVSREAVVAAGWGRRTGWLHNVEGRHQPDACGRNATRESCSTTRRRAAGVPSYRQPTSRLSTARMIGAMSRLRRS